MATSTVSPSAPAATVVKKPKRRKIIVILVVVLALAAVGSVAGYFLIDYFKPAAAKAPPPKPPADPVYVALAPLTVNLQPGDKHRFLHVGVTLKVADAKAQAMVNQYLPEVTSRVLLVLSNRQSESLVTNEDKQKLAAEALAILNQPFGPNLPAVKISSVMFPVFMFQ
jgi:flagellar FliL protein